MKPKMTAEIGRMKIPKRVAQAETMLPLTTKANNKLMLLMIIIWEHIHQLNNINPLRHYEER